MRARKGAEEEAEERTDSERGGGGAPSLSLNSQPQHLDPLLTTTPSSQVTVKWQKETHEVDLDLSQPPAVLKAQLFALTGVPPARQKVMGVKGGMLKDDAEWSATGIKEGSKLMMMGTADAPPEAPKEAVVFLEDLPSTGGGAAGAASGLPLASGLENLGNTCYMNATVQCLFQVPELKTALDELSSKGSAAAADSAAAINQGSWRLALATGETFSSLARAAATTGDAVSPHSLLAAMRSRFPQFAQAGPGGVPAQQDAEECWSQLLFVLKECLKEGGVASSSTDVGVEEGDDESAAAPSSSSSSSRRTFASAIDRLFGVRTRAVLTCEATGESVTVDGDGSVVAGNGNGSGPSPSSSQSPSSSSALALKCNITSDVNHLTEGIALGLAEDREMASAKLGGSLALFKGSSKLTRLPPYLTVQLVRFFYKTDVGQKAKVLRKVSFPMTLDAHDWSSEELKKALEGPRAAASAAAAAAAVKGRAGGGGEKKEGEEGENGGDAKMKEPEPEAAPPSTAAAAPPSFSGRPTGRYDLAAVLTHKGRSADSGHYVAWARDEKDATKKRWLQYDDDDVIERTSEDVLALSGGGDWHMAYLLLYKAELAP